MRNFALFFALFFIKILLVAQTATAPTAGDGSAGSPYQIHSLENLYWLTQNSAEWDKYYIQTADIYADMTAWDPVGDGSNRGFTPIGNSTTNFTGQYDGQDYKIDGLYIDYGTADYKAMFGYVHLGAVLKNINLTNVDITGRIYVGALAGVVNNACTVSNCTVAGSVTGTDNNIGGLIGVTENTITITNCSSNCSVDGSSYASNYVGGLIGHVDNTTTITSSSATGAVSGDGYVGGFVGVNSESSSISSCYCTGNVTSAANDARAGGFVGNNNGSSITGCYCTGTVSGINNAGGFAGYSFTDFSNDSEITNCYCTGYVTGTGHNIGGFIGKSEETTISGSYSTGTATASSYAVGGFVGYAFNDAEFENCYSTGAVSGHNQTGGFVGLGEESALTNCWTSSSVDGTGYDYIGGFVGYGDKVDADSCYSSASPLGDDYVGGFAGYLTGYSTQINACYTTVSEITSTGDYIGGFVGEVNGSGTLQIDNSYSKAAVTSSELYVGGFAGSVISGLIDSCYCAGNVVATKTGTTDTKVYVGGFIGSCESTSTTQISYCYSYSDVDYTGVSTCVGGLIGFINNTSCTVTSSFATGNISSGGDYVGGLIGYSPNISSIDHSYSTGTVTGDDYVGGLIGYNKGTSVSYCYSTGNVIGADDYVGGLIGYNKGTSVSYCYSTGYVSGDESIGGLVGKNEGTVTTSYWDAENSEQSTGCGTNSGTFSATGLTTDEIRDPSNLTDFDFSTIWEIRTGLSYCALQAEIDNAPFAFDDSVLVETSVSLTEILDNDYDYETLQASLTYEVISETSHYGTYSGGVYTLVTPTKYKVDTVVYRVGEILSAGDTLWGNQATAYLIPKCIVYPVVRATSLSLCGAGTASFLAIADSAATIFSWYTEAVGGDTLATGATYKTGSISSSITYYVSGTLNGCTTPTRYGVKLTVYPDTAYWTGGGSCSNWNNAANWDPGIPGTCSDVVVQSSLDVYPDISAESTIAIHNILFEPGASVFGLENLDYNEATVQVSLVNDKWYMLTTPLKEMYSGDYYFTGAPQAFMKLFGTEEASEKTFASSYQLVGDWTESFASMTEELTSGEGFAFRIDTIEWDYPNGYNVNTADTTTISFPRLNADGSLIRAVIPYSGVSGKPYPSIADTMAKDSTKAYRFAMEDEGDTLAPYVIHLEEGLNLIGNPLMSYLDFTELYEDNDEIIEDYVRFWDGESFADIKIDGTTSGTVDGLSLKIPPMKSFVVYASTEGDLTIDLDHYVAYTTDMVKLRSAKVKQNTLYIEASNSEGHSSTAIVNNIEAENGYDAQDVVKLFTNLNEIPDVYTSSDGKAISIDEISSYPCVIPIGIKGGLNDSVQLGFNGVSSFADAEIYLLNTQTGEYRQLVEGEEIDLLLDELNSEGSLFLEFRSASVSANDGLVNDAYLDIYTDNQSVIHIESTSDNLINDVFVYDAQGKLISRKKSVCSESELLPIGISGSVIVVNVVLEKGIKTKKIIL